VPHAVAAAAVAAGAAPATDLAALRVALERRNVARFE